MSAKVIPVSPPVRASRPVDVPPELKLQFWIALGLIAIVSGLAGGLLMRLLYWVQSVAWNEQGRTFYAAVVGASAERKVVTLMLAATVVAGGMTALRLLKGGHAGELVVAIWYGDGRMPMWRTLARAVLSVLTVGLGAAVGREGALKQTGAVVGWQAAHRFGFSKEERRILTACGAGAGMAAAYNIPLGGAVFALEILLGTFSWTVALPAFTCSIIATVTSWILLPMQMTYATPTYILTPNLVAWAACVGPVIGFIAIGYVRLIGWADLHRPKHELARILGPLLVFATLAAAAIWWPELVGNGKDVVQLAFEGDQQDPHMHLAVGLVGLAIARALATALCLRSGTPGGLFTPTMTCGALLGAGGGKLWAELFPHNIPGSYAVIGSAAMLAAATGGPISAVVAIMELGRHISVLVAPILLASAGATIVLRLSRSPSIYTVRAGKAAAEHQMSDQTH